MSKTLSQVRLHASDINTGKRFQDLSSPFKATHVAETAGSDVVSSIELQALGGGWYRDELGRPLRMTELGVELGDQPFSIRSVE